MKKVILIYDDRGLPKDSIQSVVGKKRFSQIIVKRKTVRDLLYDSVSQYSFVSEFIDVSSNEFFQIEQNQLRVGNSFPVVLILSNFVVVNKEQMSITLEKAPFIKECICVSSPTPAMFIFPTGTDFLQYWANPSSIKFENLSSDFLMDIADMQNFTQYISGGFDARYFNSLKGDKYIVTKSSIDQKKIKSEYEFYHLLPESMKMWFVMPFNYQESKDYASYSMERYNMTDIALRWVHGAISLDELDHILNKLFYFINTRAKKLINNQEYTTLATNLFLNKLDKRIEELKSTEAMGIFEQYIKFGTKYSGIDEIVKQYKTLYSLYQKKLNSEYVSVVGHGDLCFSNILYYKETDTLKLIDPKGALTQEELWANPYYDIAKLSHSICGLYDFFNANLFHVFLNQDMNFDLHIEFDNTQYKELFKKYLTMNGFDYGLIRLFEASLFLSMLPLHIDNPHKVFGFILNAINILEEVKLCLNK